MESEKQSSHHREVIQPVTQSTHLLAWVRRFYSVLLINVSVFELKWFFSFSDVSTDHFTAKFTSFVNYAGFDAGQAVALRTEGSFLAFQDCSVEGYQESLFTHSGLSKFFYDCHIYGTVDFIFGDAKVIFQNSYIYTTPISDPWSDIITAQGRYQESDRAATVLHNCTITTAPWYDYNLKSYLGRPWKDYSRTVIMKSFWIHILLSMVGPSLMEKII